MNRRDWLVTLSALLFADRKTRASGKVMIETVSGPRRLEDLGFVLPHEHVLVDFVGAEQATSDRYDRHEVTDVVLPHLRQAHAQGVETVFECTPAYLGRDPLLLRRLAGESGLNIVTNTGYYAANGGKHLPAHSRTESADELAARWIVEAQDGIEGTGMKPGFIKIGVDAGPLDAMGRKLIQAAARTHRATGLTIAAHCGDGGAAMEQLEILQDEGVDPSAWIWVHAQSESERALHRKAAELGSWVEFDGIGPDSIVQHVALVEHLRGAGFLKRVLVSHDAGWYQVGEADGGTFRPYDMVVGRFLPALRDAGFTAEEVATLTRDNPREAFRPGVRLGRSR